MATIQQNEISEKPVTATFQDTISNNPKLISEINELKFKLDSLDIDRLTDLDISNS